MAVVEILDVRRTEPDGERLYGYSVDTPAAGSDSEVATIVVGGWVVGRQSPARAVEITHQGEAITWASADLRRQDVAALLPNVPGILHCGFQASVDVAMVPSEFELGVRAVLQDGSRVSLATITGRHRVWYQPAEPRGRRAAAVARRRTAGPTARRSRCSIVIPVHNRASLTRQCLKTLLAERHALADVEIVVVDDASTDLTPRFLADYAGRGVRGLRHAANVGFATSGNDGAAIATGEYLIFLNNDTIPQPGWLDALVDYAEGHPKAAVVGSKLLFPNDTVQHCGVVIGLGRYPRHVYLGFPGDDPAVNTSRRFQIVTAAGALFRREVFEEAGGFDTAFVNGWEDIDLCLRLGELGHEVHYCHESVLYHLEAGSRDVTSPFERHNSQLYASRWLNRVAADELRYYLEDGLLSVEYSSSYPLRITASPLLATLGGAERDRQADRLLTTRSWQVLNLLKHNIQLNARLQDAELRLAVDNGHGSRSDGADPRVTPRATPLGSHPASARLVAEGAVHPLSEEPSGRLLSVILLVRNGGAALRGLVPRIIGQQSPDSVEIVAVDLGSVDDTVDVLREAQATVVRVDPQTFDPGLTRNLAAHYAKGAVLVFLDQAALPDGDRWLANLVAPLAGDEGPAAVSSRVLPREDADLLAYRAGLDDPNASAERRVVVLPDRAASQEFGPDERRRWLRFHLLSAAVRPAVLAEIPFPAGSAGRVDALWAKEVLEAGHSILHEPSSVVRHSVALEGVDLLRRGFDEGMTDRSVLGESLAERDVVPRILERTREDWRYLAEMGSPDQGDLDDLRMRAVVRRTAEVLGRWLGGHLGAVPDEVASLLSPAEGSQAGAAERVAQAAASATP